MKHRLIEIKAIPNQLANIVRYAKNPAIKHKVCPKYHPSVKNVIPKTGNGKMQYKTSAKATFITNVATAECLCKLNLQKWNIITFFAILLHTTNGTLKELRSVYSVRHKSATSYYIRLKT